jgi:lysozyme family protein
MTKKKKKLTDDELKEIFEKVYVDRTDYKNLDKSVDYEHLSDDYDLIGGIIHRKKKKD